MRRIWSRIFVLCIACMICMSGLCLAYVPEEGNWARYWLESSAPYYLDVDSVKVTEYNGRKYLEYITVYTDYHGTSREHFLLDIEKGNKKRLCLGLWNLVIQNDKLVSERRVCTNDISDITNTDRALYGDGWLTGAPDSAIQWVEQNRPDIINEIHTFNHPAARGNVDVTNVTGDMTPSGFAIAEDGAVHYTVRSPRRSSGAEWEQDTDPPHFIFARSASLSKVPGGFPAEYIVACIVQEEWYGGIHAGTWWPIMAFDYDVKSNTFTFYGIRQDYADFDYNNRIHLSYLHRIRVNDRNNVYYEWDTIGRDVGDGQFSADYRGLLSYKKTPSVDFIHKEHLAAWPNDDGYMWYGKCEYTPDGRTLWHDDLITDEVDAALAFLAARGKITEAPEDFWENSSLGDTLPL